MCRRRIVAAGAVPPVVAETHIVSEQIDSAYPAAHCAVHMGIQGFFANPQAPGVSTKCVSGRAHAAAW